MHKPESIPENETHKILWNFKVETNHLIPTRIPNGSPNLRYKTWLSVNQQGKKKKRTCHLVDFAFLANHKVKMKEIEKTDRYRPEN